MGDSGEIALSKEAVSPPGLSELSEKREVLKAILKRECDGLPLNYTAVLRQDRKLHTAVLRAFGRWDSAMRAAGIDPDRVRSLRRWSRQAVVRHIRQFADEDRPLNAAAVQKASTTLASAALRWFGSWNDALVAAGIDPAKWSKRVPMWTPGRLIRTIRRIHARGGKVNHGALRRNSVLRAAKIFYGSWDAALRAAGLDPDDIRIYRKRWTPEEVILEIQRKHLCGEPLNAKHIRPCSLQRRAKIFFGSWDAALATAGLDPAKVRKDGRAETGDAFDGPRPT